MQFSVKWFSIGQAQYDTIYLQKFVFFFWLTTNSRSKPVTIEEFIMHLMLVIAVMLVARDISYHLLEKGYG